MQQNNAMDLAPQSAAKTGKKFLYLVQARAELAEKHLALESETADVIIYCFDKDFQLPKFLYKPDTTLIQGRNILIEYARGLKQKYDYYIIMDDDIEFIKGSYEELQSQVLENQLDLCVCYYVSEEFDPLYKYHEKSPFAFSVPIYVDDCLVCYSQEIFFDNRILPYSVSGRNSVTGEQEMHEVWKFWLNVCEYLYDKKFVYLNKIHIANTNHLGHSTYEITPEALQRAYDLAKETNPNYKNRMKKLMPLYYQLYFVRPFIKDHLDLANLKNRFHNMITRYYRFRQLHIFGTSVNDEQSVELGKLRLIRWLLLEASFKNKSAFLLLNLKVKILKQLVRIKDSGNIMIYLHYWLFYYYLRYFWRDRKLNRKIARESSAPPPIEGLQN